MGQQQLLLVILVTIIIGIATVVALNTFGSTLDNAAVRAVQVDLINLGEASQAYFERAKLMGGGGRTFNDIDFSKFTFPGNIDEDDNLIAYNENGTYTIIPVDANQFIIEAEVNDSESRMIAIRICSRSIALGDVDFGTAPTPPPCP